MKNYSLFQTQYVVWNNLNLEQTHRTVEAYQLAAWVLDMAEIHEGTMIRYHQSYLDGENREQAAVSGRDEGAGIRHSLWRP